MIDALKVTFTFAAVSLAALSTANGAGLRPAAIVLAQAATAAPGTQLPGGVQKDVSGETNANENTGQLEPKQVIVADIIGKRMLTLNNLTVGTVDAVITDAQKKPFAIVGKDGQERAVDLSFAYLKGNDILLSSTADPGNLPIWTDSQLQTSGMQKLDDTQTVTMAAVIG